MADDIVYDEMLGELRTSDVSGGTGGGTTYVGGTRISIGGETISFVDSADIVNVTGTSVTLQPDTAYKIYATSQAITLNANLPAAGKWAYDGHLEIFTGTGYVVTGTNVVFANALEPDAVNNCTVRFHDGYAIISVEDHVAGYIVVNGSTSGDGSLYYGITTSTNDYVAFDATTNGAVIDLAGAVAEGEKHIVGNGYAETTLTGAVDCGTSKFTVVNLALSNVQVTGGTMTLGDAYIPSGSTVAVSGGGLAVEKVTGNGGVIDLGQTNIRVPTNQSSYIKNVTITNGLANNGGAISNQDSGTLLFSGTTFSANVASAFGGAMYLTTGFNFFENCLFENNHNMYRGGAVCLYARTSATFSLCQFASNYTSGNGGALYLGTYADCNFSSCGFLNNSATSAGGVLFSDGADVKITMGGCVISGNIPSNDAITLISGSFVFTGSNALGDALTGTSGSVTISSGAIIDLTGNPTAPPIVPGGGIEFAQGGATVICNAQGSVSSCTIDNVIVPNLGNDCNITSSIIISSPSGRSASLIGVDTSNTGFEVYNDCTLTLTDCNTKNITIAGTNGTLSTEGTLVVRGTLSFYLIISYATEAGHGVVQLEDNATLTTTRTGTSVAIGFNLPIKTLIVGSGVTINGNEIAAGTYNNCTVAGNGTITEA